MAKEANCVASSVLLPVSLIWRIVRVRVAAGSACTTADGARTSVDWIAVLFPHNKTDPIPAK